MRGVYVLQVLCVLAVEDTVDLVEDPVEGSTAGTFVLNQPTNNNNNNNRRWLHWGRCVAGGRSRVVTPCCKKHIQWTIMHEMVGHGVVVMCCEVLGGVGGRIEDQ